jgi:hypothetical protein
MMSNLKIQCREKSFVNKHPTYGWLHLLRRVVSVCRQLILWIV